MDQDQHKRDMDYLVSRMKQFKLVDMRENLPDLLAEARTNSMDHMDFLLMLFRTEEEGKLRRRHEKLLEGACFDSVQELEDINYGFNPSLDQDRISSLGRLGFLKAKENVIIIGPPGVGKSMIATGIGRKACMAGEKVLFVNAKEFVDKLYGDMVSGNLMASLAELDRYSLLIIDELSYLKMDRERESLFFQVIRRRYEKGSLIITTNLPIGRWDELFTGKLAAAAILDRLLHHCHVISITGDSYRVKGYKRDSVN